MEEVAGLGGEKKKPGAGQRVYTVLIGEQGGVRGRTGCITAREGEGIVYALQGGVTCTVDPPCSHLEGVFCVGVMRGGEKKK